MTGPSRSPYTTIAASRHAGWPSRAPLLRRVASAAVGIGVLPFALGAQNPPPVPRPIPPPVRDSVRPSPPGDSARIARDSVARPDSTRRAGAPRRARAAVVRPAVRPPISGRRAFLYSLALPGYGQAKLDRPGAGALFVAIEATAIAMARKSYGDLREAKRFRGDSLVPDLVPVDSTVGVPLPPVTGVLNVFSADLVRARRLHFEDWLAVLAFNHLFAGAEAFVAANLWDLPTQVSARRGERGPEVVISVAW